jgi:hypothetical protein
LQFLNVQPDYVIVGHAYIYSAEKGRYRPHRIWNWEIRWHAWHDWQSLGGMIRSWEKMISDGRMGVETVKRDRRRLWLRFETQDTALWAASVLEDLAKSFRHLKVFRYQREVDVRAVPFTKGLAVAELGRHMGITTDGILAIGDGYNDISMLTPTVAGMTGCPINSAPEIIEQVHKIGGHIARSPSLEGVVEILDAHIEGKVSSELPKQWIPPPDLANPSTSKSPRKRHIKLSKLKKPLLLAACLFSVYMVLVSFYWKSMPFGRRLIKPYEEFARWVIGRLDRPQP